MLVSDTVYTVYVKTTSTIASGFYIGYTGSMTISALDFVSSSEVPTLG